MKNTVYEFGINDMTKGWTKENKWNYRVYVKWKDMLKRVYSEKYHENKPTYISSTCQFELHWLSYFVEHITEIDGYEYEKFINGELELDKDIKSNGKNKEYSINNCMFVNRTENSKQARKTDTYDYMKGENNPNYKNSRKVVRYNKDMVLIDVWRNSSVASKELKIDKATINRCCQFWDIDCDKDEWFKTHKKYPNKTAGGFIWKYYKQ